MPRWGCFDAYDALALDAYGTPITPGIQATQPLLSIPLVGDVGQGLLDRLSSLDSISGKQYYSYKVGALGESLTAKTTLFMAGYDWRYDIRSLAPQIDHAVEQLRLSAGSKTVTVVAHSMGGLASRNYIQNHPGATGKVSRLITVGTPLLGAPKAVMMLVHGASIIPVITSSDGVRDLSLTLPSAYQLLPSSSYAAKAYYIFNGDWDYEFFPPDQFGYAKTLISSQTRDGITWLPAATYADNALSMHQDLDGKALGVPWVQIVGTGRQSILQVGAAKTWKYTYCYELTCLDEYKYKVYFGNGDGTVALPGAEDSGPTLHYVSDVDHENMPGQAEITAYVAAVLRGESNPQSHLQSGFKTFGGTQFDFFSPVEVHVYDDQGRHTGPAQARGEIDRAIPGVDYELTGETKTVFIPDDGKSYRIEIKGTGTGRLDLQVTRYENGLIVNREIMHKIQVTPQFTARMNVAPNRANPALDADPRGDGQRVILHPQSAGRSLLDDSTAPVTRVSLSGTMGNNDWYTSPVTVTLSGEDEGGAGLYGTWYRIWDHPDFSDWAEYRAPVRLAEDGEHLLLAGSTDKAGNDERGAQVVRLRVDTTAPVITRTIQGTQIQGGYTGPVTVSLTASDNLSGLEQLEFSLDDGATWQDYSTEGIRLTLPGNHRVLYAATDRAGNRSLPAQVMIQIRQ